MATAGRIPRAEFPYGANAIGKPQSAFEKGPNLRALRIVVDRDTVRGGEAAEMLLGFAHHERVEVVTTDPSDGGWYMEIGQPNSTRDLVPVTVHHGSSGYTQTAVWPLANVRQIAGAFPGSTTDVFSALVLGRAAASANADALVTRNPTLLNPPAPWTRRDNAMTPEEAIALMGLCLRLQDDFTWLQGGSFDRDEKHSATFDSGLFYWVLSRSLLPAAWRWFSACVHSSTATGDDALMGLAGSALMRFDRVLRARDRVHEQFHLPQNNNTADEAHFYLDVLILQLVGVFDVVARVANAAYGVQRQSYGVTWRDDRPNKWRSKLAVKEPRLAAIMNPTMRARDALDLAAILRNTIHGEALQSIAVRRRAITEYSVLVPSEHRARFVSAARRLGGLEHWGLNELLNKEFLIAADRYVEALVPAAARALNRLMSATDVTRLPGVAGATLMTGPPEDRDSPFNRFHRGRVRLLGGL